MNMRPALLALTTALFLGGCSSLSSDKVSVEYYNISGNSTAALDADIKLKGPRINGGRHAVAVARIKMVPDIVFSNPIFSDNAATCDIKKAKVAVNAKVTLPRWTGRKTASRKLGRAWDSIDRYTRLHEATHVDIAFKHAKMMEDGLLALENSGTCDELRVAAAAFVQKSLLNHDFEQRKFDADEQKRFLQFAKAQRAKKESAKAKAAREG